MTDKMSAMCAPCLARIVGHACPGVYEGDECLREGGPLLTVDPASNLSELATTLYDVRQEKAALEKVEKAVLEQLKPMVDPKFDACPKAPIVVTGLTITRQDGVTRSILADLLLERGVAPDVVAYSTKTTTYHKYLVKEAK